MAETISTQKEWLDSIFDNPKLELTPEQKFAIKYKSETRLGTINNVIAARIGDRDYDAPIPITGFEGTGKSTLGIWMGLDISRKVKVPFSLYRNVMYYQPEIDQYEQLSNMLLKVPKKSTVMVDEAIKTMYSRNWSKSEQKNQNQIFTSIRNRNLFVPMLIPHLGELDTFFKQYRALWWVHIFKRGVAGLFVKDPNPFNPDPFNIKDAFRIIRDKQYQQTNMFDVNEMIKTLRDYVPNFLTWFRFKPLPKRVDLLYNRLKTTYREELPEQERSAKEKLDEMLKTSIITLYEASDDYTPEVLAKRFSVSPKKVRDIIKKARGLDEEAKPEQEKEEGDSDEQDETS